MEIKALSFHVPLGLYLLSRAEPNFPEIWILRKYPPETGFLTGEPNLNVSPKHACGRVLLTYGSHECEKEQGAWEEIAGRKGENDGDPVLI